MSASRTRPDTAGEVFAAAGGQFLLAADRLAQKLAACRALVFDWDGVFNAGQKGATAASTFSEADSMGTNMLRFAMWSDHGELPVCAVLSGAKNESAIDFAEREHFDAVYTGVADKRNAIQHLCERRDIEPTQIACFFDDINDLGMAGMCGVRIFVRRDASPLLQEYVKEQNLCDYVTAAEGGNHAVREACEMLLGVSCKFAQTVTARTEYSDAYATYFNARQLQRTSRYAAEIDASGKLELRTQEA